MYEQRFVHLELTMDFYKVMQQTNIVPQWFDSFRTIMW